MTAFVMRQPYFICGQNFADCSDKESFVKLLSKKVGINPEGISALAFNNSHAMYVITQLEITGPGAGDKMRILLHWFWDDKNQLMKFTKKNVKGPSDLQ